MGNQCHCDKNVTATDAANELNLNQKNSVDKDPSKNSRQNKEPIVVTPKKNGETNYPDNSITQNNQNIAKFDASEKVKERPDKNKQSTNLTGGKDCHERELSSENNEEDKKKTQVVDKKNQQSPKAIDKSESKIEESFVKSANHVQKNNENQLNSEKASIKQKESINSAKGNEKKGNQAGERSKKKIYVDNQSDERISENIITLEKQMNPTEATKLKNILKNHYVFLKLADEEIDKIVSLMSFCTNATEKYIFQQGDKHSDSFFVIESGKCYVIIDGVEKKALTPGETFGEKALLYNAPRSASIMADPHSKFWAIDRKTFQIVIAEITQRYYSENREFIEKVPFFEQLTNSQKDALTNHLIVEKFKSGDVIVAEGDMAASYYVIKEGEVSVRKGQDEVRKLKAGETFGEKALYEDGVRSMSVVSTSNTTCVALSREDLIRVFGGQIQDIILKNYGRWGFQNNKLLKSLSNVQVEKLLRVMEVDNVEKNVVIYTKGNKYNQLLVILDGCIQLNDSGQCIYKGYIWGENYLENESRDKIINETIIMKEPGKVGKISVDKFFKIIGTSLEEAIAKNANNHEKKIQVTDDSFKRCADNLSLNDFLFIKHLGAGQFGKVMLSKSKTLKKYFAIKMISKHSMMKNDAQKFILNEKKALEISNNPFILTGYRALKDENNIYFLTDFIRGIEMFDAIRDIGILNNEEAKFYIASMIIALEYLHFNQMVYRDLKPENIMIDKNGYMTLIDLGTCTSLKKEKGFRTYTMIGTPHYMAPEIFKGRGYGFSVDFWSLGIVLFEFVCGMLPFGDDLDDPHEICAKIQSEPLKFPPGFTVNAQYSGAKNLMELLLVKTPERRLGSESFAKLKAHPWFDDFDWDLLMDKQMKAPYKPHPDLLLSDNEIKEMEQYKIPLLSEIKKCTKKSDINYESKNSLVKQT